MLLPRPWSFAWLLAGSMAVLAEAEEAVTPDVKSIPLRTHSLVSPYLDSDMQSRWFDFGGDTIVRADQYIRLASDRPSQSGWVFSRVPLTATNWEIEVEFKISGNGNLYGDGMAMWITQQRAQPGPVFGSVDKFEGLGIFFDTYKNNRPGVVFPYVMAMLGDGNTPYDQGNDGKSNELAGCSARGIRNQAIPTKARLTYFQDKNLVLELQYKSEDTWTPCFEIPEIKLPSVAYLGFSAATGELSDNFDIIKVETKNLYSAVGGTAGQAARKEFSKSKGKSYDPSKLHTGSGWSWFMLKFVFFGLALTGAYVGFTMWRANRRRDRF
ncbi:vesicular integral-membrane protein VIP36 precursor [Cryomyces antarcticus]|nr:hypothetical protein LTR04_000781 [Oleoguttula sp. CCFEE 6159]